MDAASIIFGALVATAIPYFFRVEKYIRRVNRVLQDILKGHKNMVTQDQFKLYTNQLDAAVTAKIAAMQKQIDDATAAPADFTAAAAAVLAETQKIDPTATDPLVVQPAS